MIATPAGIPRPRWNEVAREYVLRRDAAVLRGPVEWSWDVTNHCIGRCSHCFNRSGVLVRDELDGAELQRVANEIADLKPLGLCLCGGEPLLRADEILPVAASLGGAGVTVNMVTNGQLVTSSMATRVRDAGIQMVQVSLDGASAVSHDRLRGVPGLWEGAVRGIRELRRAGLTVGVAFTPTSFNISEWRGVYELCEELGVFELRVQPLMPLGEGLLTYDEVAPSEEQYRAFVDEYRGMVLECSESVSVQWGDPVDHLIRFGQFFAMPPYTMHITSDGLLMPSVYLPVVIGSVRRHALAEYWAAGANLAWQIRLVRELAYRVRSNRDFAAIRPHPFYDPPVDIDLVDRTPREIEELTDVVLAFVERTAPDPARPPGPWTWRPASPRARRFMADQFGIDPGGTLPELPTREEP